MGMNTKKGPDEVKCVIVGDGAVGKTSMLLSYTTGGIMMDYIPTCFDCYTADIKLREKNYTLSLVDTAGQETYDRLRTLAYYDTDVFVLCFSVADEDSFDNIKTKWIPEIRQYRPHTPFILVGTQCDLRDSNKVLMMSHPTESVHVTSSVESVCVARRRAKALARKCGARAYMECSALEGTGIKEVFETALLTATAPKPKRAPHFVKTLKSVFRFRRHRHHRDSERENKSA